MTWIQTACNVTLAASLAAGATALRAEGLDPAEVEAFADAHFEEAMAASGIPGAVVAVVRDGETVLLKGYGTSDVESGAPVDPERTLYRLGSITKPLLAIATLRLVERGLLDLDTDVNAYLKDVSVPAAYGEPVTLRHLLSHTAGFDADLSFSEVPVGTDHRMSAEEIERRLQRVRPPSTLR